MVAIHDYCSQRKEGRKQATFEGRWYYSWLWQVEKVKQGMEQRWRTVVQIHIHFAAWQTRRCSCEDTAVCRQVCLLLKNFCALIQRKKMPA